MASKSHRGKQRCDMKEVLSEIKAIGLLATWLTILFGMWGFVTEMFWQR